MFIIVFSVLYLINDDAEGIIISNNTEEILTDTLPDGTVVWLDTATTIQLAVDFGEENRDLATKGNVYFKVAENTMLPFIIEAGGAFVRVTGTEFEVKSYAEGNSTRLVSNCIENRSHCV